MTAIRIEAFSGMAPRLSNRLLQINQAAEVQNARLVSGELRGSRTPALEYRFMSGTVRNTMRARKADGTYVWIPLSTFESTIVKGPLTNDAHDRYYWKDAQAYLEYNSLARIENGDPAYKLGVPAPTAAAALAVTGGTGTVETRVYTYTFVNSFGEESAPAPVALLSGFVNGTWNLTGLATVAVDGTGRATVTAKRIYRTVTGQATVSYFFVAEIALAAATYNDTSLNALVASKVLLKSFTWDAPLNDLDGVIAHPNGFLVAYKGRNIYFSERFRPHAWPAEYTVSVEDSVVALSIYNNMITVLTRGKPYFAAGISPAGMSLIKSEAAEPCLSKNSVASTLSGVMYASPNGLVLYNESGPRVLTSSILTIEEWSNYSPSTLKGAQYGTQYIGFYTSQKGVAFAPGEPFGVFSEIDNLENVDNVLTDHTTGECWLLRQNRVEQWEPPTGVPLFYRWLSKEFDFPEPVNFGALMVKMRDTDPATQIAYVALLSAFNALRIVYSLNELNTCELNGVHVPDIGNSPVGVDTIPGYNNPIGGSPLYLVPGYEDALTSMTLIVYADGRNIASYTPLNNTMYRIPSGFKAHTWQFELIGNSTVYSLAVAETAKGLRAV